MEHAMDRLTTHKTIPQAQTPAGQGPDRRADRSGFAILRRTLAEIVADRVTLVAAGVTYYLLLALFPALSAIVSVYGLFADPQDVSTQVQGLYRVLPQGGTDLISGKLKTLAAQPPGSLSLALVLSIALALWSASAGVRAMIDALDVAYDVDETRGFFRVTLVALAFTLAGVGGSVVLIGAVVAAPALLGVLGLSAGLQWIVSIGSYALAVAVLFGGVAALYRFGPNRPRPHGRWITPGVSLAVLLIVIVSLLFSWYAANVAHFDKTYGALGGLIGFLTWIWVSLVAVITGAELDAERAKSKGESGAPLSSGGQRATKEEG
jgi:membrane protein